MFTTARDVKTFALGGNATLTLSSVKTGVRYTLKISAPSKEGKQDHDSGIRFVSLLTGADNESSYTYLGMIKGVPTLETGPTWTLTKASRMTADSAPVRAAKFLCDRVLRNPEAPLPADLEIRHDGRCGCCGRKLTVPESIDRGIGPECAERMGVA